MIPSSSQHGQQSSSKELMDLVKLIGSTQTKEEEDKIILAEQSRLRASIKSEQSPSSASQSSLFVWSSARQQRENLIRAIYIEMLGHDASFAHFPAVQIAQAKNLSMKRLGYLSCCLFLQESSDVLILLVANLQKDLQSKSINEIVIALTALAKLLNPAILRGTIDHVLKLLNHPSDLIRKKAMIVIHRVQQIQSDALPAKEYEEIMHHGILDSDFSVQGIAVNMYFEAVKLAPHNFRHKTHIFLSLLRSIVEGQKSLTCSNSKLKAENNEFMYDGMKAPWVQIKLLRILGMLGKNDLIIAENMHEQLKSTLERYSTCTTSITYAITYQCVKTIAEIYPIESLLEHATKAIAKFLQMEDINLKYLGINALISIVNESYLMEYQQVIMECLEMQDETLKRETILLLLKMCSRENVSAIVDQFIRILKKEVNVDLKKELVVQISNVAERHSPSAEWYLKIMNVIFEQFNECISHEMLNSFLRIIADQSLGEQDSQNAFGVHVITVYLTIAKLEEVKCKKNSKQISDVIYQIIAWVFGEIGAAIYGSDTEKLKELVERLLIVVSCEFENEETRGWVINALAKLSSCAAFSMQSAVTKCFEYYSGSAAGSVASRALEYKILAKYNVALRQSTQISVDPDLKFLDSFVASALLNGAPKFNRQKAAETLHFENERFNRNKSIIQNNQVDEGEVLVASETIISSKQEKIEKQNDFSAVDQMWDDSDNEEPLIIPNRNQSDSQIWSLDGFNDKQSLGSNNQNEERPSQNQSKQQKGMLFLEKNQSVISKDSCLNATQKKPFDLMMCEESLDELKSKLIEQQQEEEFIDETLVSPLRISIELFEANWNDFSIQNQIELSNTCVTTEGGFRILLRRIGIVVIKVEGNELTCAGKVKKSPHLVLMEGSFSQNGDLRFKMKTSASIALIDQIIIQIRKFSFEK